jgi:hypothetical protein
MWPFKSTNWDKLGTSWDYQKVEVILLNWKRPELIKTRDTVYRGIPYKDYKYLMGWRRSRPRYASQIWDCDNFADGMVNDVNREWAERCSKKEALLHGYVEGLIIKDGIRVRHAWAWQVDDRGIGRFIEPQNDSVFDTSEYIYEMRA